MGATFSRVKTWVTGDQLTASDLNGEFNNILTNLTPAGIDDASASTSAMRATSDPYPAGTESLAATLTTELQQVRYVLAQITGKTYWYQDPDTTLTVSGLQTGTFRPAFGVTLASDQTIAAGSDVQVQFDTETFDTNADFASYTWTPTVAGYYLLTGHLRVTISKSSGSHAITVTIRKNGSAERVIFYDGSTVTLKIYNIPISCMVSANGSTDAFDIVVNHSADSAVVTSGATVSCFQGICI